MSRLVGDQIFGIDSTLVDPDLIEGGLRSKQFATILDLLGSGEIDSIFDAGGAGTDTFRKSIFLNKTPLMDANGKDNFSDVQVFFKNGASNQTAIQEINATESTVPVGVAVTKSPLSTAKTGTYTQAGHSVQTVSGVVLAANHILVEISSHGFNVGDVIEFTPTSGLSIVQQRNILSVPDSGKFVVLAAQDNVPTSGNCSVQESQGISRSITNTSVDKVRVSIQIPALQRFSDTDGSISGEEVKISIRITENDGTVTNPVILNSINGKASSPYVRDYEIVFERTMSFPITITVIRNTEDNTNERVQNATNWLSFTEIITDSRAYQGFAYVGLRFNAQEFQNYPSRRYLLKGTKIKIPHNGTVNPATGAVSYTGTFNGTFKADKEWSSDPAWILYDLLTTDKGFGGADGFIDEDGLDVFSFYSASAYASEEIFDPFTGTTEPRFSCNVIIQQQQDAYTVINDLCSVMNAMPFYGVGTLQIAQDRPTNQSEKTSDPQYIFNNSNVTQAGFTYSGTGNRVKYTQVEVAFFDNETQEIDYEFISWDSEVTDKFGKNRKTLKAFACTSRGQANRLGRWFLYTQIYEGQTVSFTTTLEAGVVVRPSTIIGVADSVKAGVRRGGRIKSVTNTTTIVVDDANNTDLTAINVATLSVIMPDGTTEKRNIDSVSGSTITVSSAFSTTPQVNSIWAIENTTVEFQTFRVLAVEEAEGSNYKISAIVHDDRKYTFVEDRIGLLEPRPITTLIKQAESPSNLTASEQIIVLNNRAVSKIFFAWEPSLGIKEYLIEVRFNNDNPERFRISRPSFDITEAAVGTYTIAVKSYNSLGVLSATTSTLVFTSIGKTALPKDPKNLTIEPVSEQFVRLRFDPSLEKDVVHGGAVQVRHTPSTDPATATFANSTDIIPQIAGNSTEALVPALSGTYSIKFIDDGGRRSANAARVIVTQPDPQPHQVILTQREDTTSPPFLGEKTRTRFDANFNGLVLDGSNFFDNLISVDLTNNFDFLTGDIFGVGTYDFQNIVDLGAIFNLTLKRRFVTFANIVNDLFDFRLTLLEDILDFDGAAAENCNAKLLVSTSQGNPAIATAATYSQTQDLITLNATSHGAGVGDNFRIDFTSGTADDGFLKVASVTNANVCVLEAKRKFAQYLVIGGQLRFFTDGDHGGLVEDDDVKIVFLTGSMLNQDAIFNVATRLPNGTVVLDGTNNRNGEGVLEFIKIKDSSNNDVTTSGNCNISSPFSTFNTFANGEYNARAFKFQVEMTSTDPDETINVSELGFEASVKRRTETVNTAIASQCATTGTAKTVTFQHPFFAGTGSLGGSTSAFLPTIGITLEGASSGDFFAIQSVTGTQFTILTGDSSGLKDLSFKYTAIGFGKGE